MRPAEEKRKAEGKRIFEALKRAKTRAEAEDFLSSVSRAVLYWVAWCVNCEYMICKWVKKAEVIEIILNEFQKGGF